MLGAQDSGLCAIRSLFIANDLYTRNISGNVWSEQFALDYITAEECEQYIDDRLLPVVQSCNDKKVKPRNSHKTLDVAIRIRGDILPLEQHLLHRLFRDAGMLMVAGDQTLVEGMQCCLYQDQKEVWYQYLEWKESIFNSDR